jgi:hypothetical protein
MHCFITSVLVLKGSWIYFSSLASSIQWHQILQQLQNLLVTCFLHKSWHSERRFTDLDVHTTPSQALSRHTLAVQMEAVDCWQSAEQ